MPTTKNEINKCLQHCCNYCIRPVSDSSELGKAQKKARVCKNCHATYHFQCGTRCTRCGGEEFREKRISYQPKPKCRRRPKSNCSVRLPAKQRRKQRTQRTPRPPISFSSILIRCLTFILFVALFFGLPTLIDAIKDMGGRQLSTTSIFIVPQIVFSVFWIILRKRNILLTFCLTGLLGGYCYIAVKFGYFKFDPTRASFYFVVFALLLMTLWAIMLRISSHRLHHSKIDKTNCSVIEKTGSHYLMQMLLIGGLAFTILLVSYQLYRHEILPRNVVSRTSDSAATALSSTASQKGDQTPLSSGSTKRGTESEIASFAIKKSEFSPFNINDFLRIPFVAGLLAAGLFVAVISAMTYRVLARHAKSPLFFVIAMGIAAYFYRVRLLSIINHYLGADKVADATSTEELFQSTLARLNTGFQIDFAISSEAIAAAWVNCQAALVLGGCFLIIAFGFRWIGYELCLEKNSQGGN